MVLGFSLLVLLFSLGCSDENFIVTKDVIILLTYLFYIFDYCDLPICMKCKTQLFLFVLN